ncbi:Hypothetical_protein [Hexamita inflata]|uniref:Hypothetical_protein n=1 Tax=Hexamita inflata TaxID=28002 RepID=A0AA86R7N7_9EUKA|nr:Hypothetical protein HINF_LOCUS60859 [Hexamita inflata]
MQLEYTPISTPKQELTQLQIQLYQGNKIAFESLAFDPAKPFKCSIQTRVSHCNIKFIMTNKVKLFKLNISQYKSFYIQKFEGLEFRIALASAPDESIEMHYVTYSTSKVRGNKLGIALKSPSGYHFDLVSFSNDYHQTQIVFVNVAQSHGISSIEEVGSVQLPDTLGFYKINQKSEQIDFTIQFLLLKNITQRYSLLVLDTKDQIIFVRAQLGDELTPIVINDAPDKKLLKENKIEQSSFQQNFQRQQICVCSYDKNSLKYLGGQEIIVEDKDYSFELCGTKCEIKFNDKEKNIPLYKFEEKLIPEVQSSPKIQKIHSKTLRSDLITLDYNMIKSKIQPTSTQQQDAKVQQPKLLNEKQKKKLEKILKIKVQSNDISSLSQFIHDNAMIDKVLEALLARI